MGLHDFLLVPASRDLLNQWRENLNELVSNLVLYANCSIPDALNTCMSDANLFFNSSAFSDWKKGKESVIKIHTGNADRLNNVVKAINNLIKSRRR